ncbi:MAG: peptide chain release factor 1 [Bacillota bacterium]|nr:peptide chain release factor 1 [Bacillota bacterium]
MTRWQDKLASVEERYGQLEAMLGDPEVIRRGDWHQVARERARLEPLVEKYREYRRVEEERAGLQELLRTESDPELRQLAGSELEELDRRREDLDQEIRILLLPRDPNDERNVVVEIRAGTGGEEAALFAGDLYRMYTRYAEARGWRTEMLSASLTDLGGFKEAVFAVEGNGAYSRLKYESGVHRVQRVPVTEAGGRIHTSTATVAVLPEAEEVDVQISPEDLHIDTFCAGGPGGQHVNKTESAVRIIHRPTGITVTCQDERSQHKNREKAMRVLRARLKELYRQQQEEAVDEERRAQVGTAERSERIRTYNFPQARVTDHRIGLTLYRLGAILEGNLDEIIDALAAHYQAERLRGEEAAADAGRTATPAGGGR